MHEKDELKKCKDHKEDALKILKMENKQSENQCEQQSSIIKILKMDIVAMQTSAQSGLTQVEKAKDLYVRNRSRGFATKLNSAGELQ